ncbi:MAG: MYG1 family protein [Lachnospiraceae bacterium]|nr:MYG1 family protein [Lachnospiraceae bacterium]MDD3616381.1 MYG1 family protein [Lachnospiraceae bacterium]
MSQLIEQINQKDAKGFTHGGKFHADDVFSAALLLYLNPEIEIFRGNRVPEEFSGIVFDIGRGKYDHHQRDARVRDNGIPYAAFGLLWEELGFEILGEELALRFDHDFVQPLDLNDNTGERNELASLIGDFNPSWDVEGNNDSAFFEAVNLASTVLENKFAKYRGNERADLLVEEFLEKQKTQQNTTESLARILVMPQFVPCQKKLSDTEIEFIIFPSNRGGYCIQPLKRPGSMNYKCSFPARWLGLENEELQEETGLESAAFCHKGGFLMSVGELKDAVKACKLSQKVYVNTPVIVYYREGSDKSGLIDKSISGIKKKLKSIEGMEHTVIKVMDAPGIPQLAEEDYYAVVDMEKEEWKTLQKNTLKKIMKEKPEAVIMEGVSLMTYPMIHLLRKKHVPVLILVTDGTKEEGIYTSKLVRIPSGS